jgi:hypothetical protein
MTHKPAPLLGEFTEVPVSALAIPPGAHSLAKAHFALVQELARLNVPHYSTDPTPDQHEDVADYLVRIAQAMDRHLKEVGREVQANATSVGVDAKCFDGVFLGAIDGNATFEIDRCAKTIREEHAEAAWTSSQYRNRFWRATSY